MEFCSTDPKTDSNNQSPPSTVNIQGLDEIQVPLSTPIKSGFVGNTTLSKRSELSLIVPLAGFVLALVLLTASEDIVNKLARLRYLGLSWEQVVFEQLARGRVEVGSKIDLLIGRVPTINLPNLTATLTYPVVWSFDHWQQGVVFGRMALNHRIQSLIVKMEEIDQAAALSLSSGIDSLDNFSNYRDLGLESINNYFSSLTAFVDGKLRQVESSVADLKLSVQGKTALVASSLNSFSGNGKEWILADRGFTQSLEASFASSLYMINEIDKALLASAGYSVDQTSLWGQVALADLKDLWFDIPTRVYEVLASFAGAGKDRVGQAISNWTRFLGFGSDDLENKSTSTVPTNLPRLSPITKEEMRQQLLDDLEMQFAGTIAELRQGSSPQVLKPASSGQEGLVVVPAGLAGEDLEDIRVKLEAMFSDPVEVSFEADGRAGIITPQFKNATDQDYLFLLTPIRDASGN
ncbi:MAG: hypothetical protein A2589_01450 [Candidatus Vogelbacteria bacterium RIFOXYD1_FULL_46_19]|uniref:Uncharacterized protein n=1 Tax=Candidatus Vogelbacteria bacterium RIFOXYD1_FULL_46_19 TaxID=1802439 RepID=A0A1G2QFW4_9BACT|nr:MAG: hypothetical protein A2589_01450 [Candidatus Vogelbacteria bacterium RIFOXYD1_FULL_46_19]